MIVTEPDVRVYPNLWRLWRMAKDAGLNVTFCTYGSRQTYDWAAGVLTISKPHSNEFEYLEMRTDDNWYDHKPKERRTRGILSTVRDTNRIGLKDTEKIIDRWAGNQ